MARTVWLLAALCAFALVLFGSWKGVDWYRGWRVGRSLNQAREALNRGDFQTAQIAILAALESKPDDPAAIGLMADLLEAAGSPTAIGWRQKALSGTPKKFDAELSLARTALRFQQPALAEQTLDSIPKSDRLRPECLEVEAGLDALSGERDEAVKILQEIIRRQPEGRISVLAKLNLGRLLIQSSDSTESCTGIELLRSIANDPRFGADALRAQIDAACRRDDPMLALRLYRTLEVRPTVSFGDRLSELDLLSSASSTVVRIAAERALMSLQLSCKTPAEVVALGNWFNSHRSQDHTIEWLKSMSPQIQQDPNVKLLLVASYESNGAFGEAEQVLSGPAWDARIESERLAILFRLYSRDAQPDQAAISWHAALEAARDQPGAFETIAAIAESAGKPNEAMDALWHVPIADPGYNAAQQTLFRYYRAENDAANLLRWAQRGLELQPDDLDSKRSVATLLLVLGRNQDRAVRLAQEVYEAKPSLMINAAVYAYSLYATGHAQEAAALLDGRSEIEKASPDCEPFYGIILAAVGRHDEARRALAKTDRSILFPEMAAVVARVEDE